MGGMRMICAIARAAGAAALIAGAAPASAASLSYVSALGSDAGDCSNPNRPCRTLVYAVPRTSAGGEIKTLTPGNYGTPTIDKSLTLTGGPGAMIIWAGSGPAVRISAGTAGVVVIHGFTLNGLGVAEVGVRIASGGSVVLRNCAIKNFTQVGVQFKSTTATKFSIEDTFITNVGTYGVQIDKTGAGSATGVIHRSTLIGPGAATGVYLGPSADARVSDSLIGFFAFGVYARADAGNALRLTRNTISQNVRGVLVETGGGTVAETAHDNFIAGNSARDVDAILGAPLTNVGTR
jgi:nitrous oxidase accessory protein NosD